MKLFRLNVLIVEALVVWSAAASGSDVVSSTAPPPLPEDIPTGPSLHVRIDQLINDATGRDGIAAAPISDDAEFLRRISLDLTGSIPSVEDVREFLRDSTATGDKRRALIDRLLASPQYSRRMLYVFDELLMERRGGANVPVAEWQDWLRESFQKNVAWDELANQVLSADGADDARRAPAKFYLYRNFDLDVVTRDIGRIFLGVDLECAQCHDHPNIGSYYQRHYYGINAFLKRSYVFTDPKSKKKMLGEKAEGDVKFTSVFTSEESQTDPRLLDLPAISDPTGLEKVYLAKPDSKVRGVPTYSRREQLAKQMLSAENVEFRRNIVNRLWALMMGRGLVEPLDVRHVDNPPSHPEVLDLLADEFHRQHYDIRWLLRELALTETYQRSSKPTSEGAEILLESFAIGLLKPLSAEQFAWSIMEATGQTSVAMKAQEAALMKADPKTGSEKKADPVWLEEALHKALVAHVATFATRFAGQGGQKTSFEASADQALFLINGPLVQGWLNPTGTSLTARLQKLDDNQALVEEIYLSTLTRLPTSQEVTDVQEYLTAVSDRGTAIKDVVWAVLSSSEFRFNH